MNSGKTIFSQLMDFLFPEYGYRYLIACRNFVMQGFQC